MLAVIVAVVIVSQVRVASAQVACPAGQSRTADTGGNCCWPAQAWSTARQSCVGVPQCPPNFAANGETCVALAPPPAPAPVTAQTSLTIAAPVVCPAGQVANADTQ